MLVGTPVLVGTGRVRSTKNSKRMCHIEVEKDMRYVSPVENSQVKSRGLSSRTI